MNNININKLFLSDRLVTMFRKEKISAKDALQHLMDARKKEHIYKSDFNQLLSPLKRGMDYASTIADKAVTSSSVDPENSRSLWTAGLRFPYQLNHVNKYLKTTLPKFKDQLPEEEYTIALEWGQAWQAVGELVKELKPFIENSRPPTEKQLARQAEQAELDTLKASNHSGAVLKVLAEKLDAIAKGYKKQIIESLILDITRAAYDNLAFLQNPDNAKQIRRYSYDYNLINQTSHRVYALADQFEDKVKKMAQNKYDTISIQFIAKALSKVESIIVRKGLDAEIEVVAKTSSNNAAIEAILKFVFTDKSEFNLNSKLKINWRWGTGHFYQYPSLFQNIVMPDGTKIKRFNELEMNKNFATV